MKYILTSLTLALSASLFGQITILEENFDLTIVPSQWTVIDNDGHTVAPTVSEYTEAWIITDDPLNPGNNVVSSTSYFTPVDRADRWLITPILNLGTTGNYISWSGLSRDPSFPDSYKVMISTTGNAIADFTDTLTVISNEYHLWTNHLEELDEYANQAIYIAFVNTTSNGFKLYLDSIYVREQDPLSLQQEEIVVAAYPNPVVNELHLSIGNANIQTITVHNTYGQEIAKEVFNNQSSAILNTTSFDSGMYIVSIETSLGTVRKRIIK